MHLTCCECTWTNVATVFCVLSLLYAWLKHYGFLPKKDIRGWHTFITGAGSGIGRGLAIKMAAMGCKLTLVDVNEDGLHETKKMIKDKTGKDDNVNLQRLDVTDLDQMDKVAKQCVAKFGDVDILINNAGIVQGRKFWELDDKFTRKLYDVNLVSHSWLINRFLGPMMKRNRGHIVSMSSYAGVTSFFSMADYNASKAGASMLMESLGGDLHIEGYYGVHTTTIQPTFINTGMFDGVKTSPFAPLLTTE